MFTLERNETTGTIRITGPDGQYLDVPRGEVGTNLAMTLLKASTGATDVRVKLAWPTPPRKRQPKGG